MALDLSVFELAVLSAPHSVSAWIRYVDTVQSTATLSELAALYERALAAVPLSYKIWTRYLKDLTQASRKRPITVCTSIAADAINAFERAVSCLPRMPVLWLLYSKFLWQFGLITRTRNAFDRALQSLPVTQHHMIWDKYAKFAAGDPVVGCVINTIIPAETATRILRRYVQLEPQGRTLLLNVLRKRKQYSVLMPLLAELVSDESYIPEPGTTRLELWNELCQLLVEHAKEVPPSMSADAVLRSGIITPILFSHLLQLLFSRYIPCIVFLLFNLFSTASMSFGSDVRVGMQKYSAETGALWSSLAHYYIRLGQFEKARDIFEESLETVTTMRDFSVIFEAYSSFEETMLAAKMEEQTDSNFVDDEDDDYNIDGDDVEHRLLRLENLMNRRPLLVNTVLLKQNPYSVSEWLKRVRIVGGNDDAAAIEVYAEAIKVITPREADGKLSNIWIGLASLYESNQSLDNARTVYQSAVAVQFRTVDELSDIWCSWIEMELREKQFKAALDVSRRVTASVPDKRERMKADAHKPVQERVWRSTKLWSLYVDLEESFGTLESARAAYTTMLDIKIATPQTVLNLAALLESHRFFEDSFRAYELGLARFGFPHAMPIWKTYLTKFVERYGGKKLERARDLFEQAVEKAPADNAKDLFLLYANLEEKYGLARHALQVYDRALQRIKDDDKIEMFQIYVTKASEMFGVARTREVYEKAIQTMPKQLVRFVIMQYAQLELKLGEVDRVRALYSYCSQFCSPTTDTNFWDTFHSFEVQHGNEDTFREMLRIRRSVAADMAQTHFVQATIAQAQALAGAAQGDKVAAQTANDMEYLEMEASLNAPVVNPEEIDIMDENEEGEEIEEEEPDVLIEQKTVPAAVFGNVGQAPSKPMGALARFKNKI